MKSEHQQTNDVLQDRLRAEPPSFSAPAGFTERVMEKLSSVEQVQRPNRPAPSLGWLRFGIAFAGAACLTFIVMQRFPGPNPGLQGPVVTADVPNTSTPVQLNVPTLSVEQVEALTAKLDEPLEKELKNVISDTRHAIQFVASNFLPEN